MVKVNNFKNCEMQDVALVIFYNNKIYFVFIYILDTIIRIRMPLF